MAQRRLFFALWPDEETRRVLRLATRGPARATGGRLVPADQFHVTLAFLGAVQATKLDTIIAAARDVAGLHEDLVLDQLSYWPKPKVYCAVPRKVPKKIMALATELKRVLHAIDGVNLSHEFRPHVTLCRGVSRAPAAAELDAVPWSVKDFVLVESQLSTRQYVVLQRFA